MHRVPYFRLVAETDTGGVMVTVSTSHRKYGEKETRSLVRWGRLGPMAMQDWRDFHAALDWGARLMGGEVSVDESRLLREDGHDAG